MRARGALTILLLQACAQGSGAVVPDARPAPPPDAPVDAAVPDAEVPPDAAPAAPCVDGVVAEEVFSTGMVGCAGSIPWSERESLCGPGYTVCSASWWVSLRSGAAPAHTYWVDEDLHYTGTATACAVLHEGGYPCGGGSPMRVCAGPLDSEGNECNWSGCGYLEATPNQHFGGCIGNTTAGALCCRAPCADGTTEDAFPGGMFGCAGSIPWVDRAALCGAGYHVCTAAEWVGGHGGVAPTHSYWIEDELDRDGVIGACAAVTAGGEACTPGRPMRICSGPTDPEGNTCSWTGCGYQTITPNRYFGGCSADANAGTLCCMD